MAFRSTHIVMQDSEENIPTSSYCKSRSPRQHGLYFAQISPLSECDQWHNRQNSRAATRHDVLDIEVQGTTFATAGRYLLLYVSGGLTIICLRQGV